MNVLSPIAILGTEGMLGRRLAEILNERGYSSVHEITTEELFTVGDGIVDRLSQIQPEYIFFAAGKSGGIAANIKHPAEFIQTNLRIQTACIDAAYRAGVSRLLFFASSCIYPKDAMQPMREDTLGSGPLERTSEAYATSRIAGMAMCRAYNVQYKTSFVTIIPATIYGPCDHFDEQNSHVLSSLVKRYTHARSEGVAEITLRGSGAPLREFIYVDDLCDAALFLMQQNDLSNDVYNAGSGFEISIKELSFAVQRAIGCAISTRWDTSQTDGASRKILDSSRLKLLGWAPRTSLEQGLSLTYQWFLTHP